MKLYKANIITSKSLKELKMITNGYVAVYEEEDCEIGTPGVIEGVYEALPDRFRACETEDFGQQLLIPGFTDLHLHPNQFPDNGIGYDLELMPWIEEYAAKSENYYSDEGKAREIFACFIRELKKYGIMRSVLFGPVSAGTTDLLFEMMCESGLGCYLGKNNKDYSPDGNGPESFEVTTQTTLDLIEKYEGRHPLVHYMLTPGFAPGCSEKLMRWVGEVAREKNLPVQTHLDENKGEVGIVKERFPECKDYLDVYEQAGMFDETIPTVMAHCIFTTLREMKVLHEKKVFVAHCPHSNFNLSSGVMPLRAYLEEGIPVGIGSDISAGHTLNMFDNMRAVLLASRTRAALYGEPELSSAEAFYLATKGGGSFFGKVGSIEPGYVFDALVVDDDATPDFRGCTMKERLERVIYQGDDRQIKKRFCNGKEIVF